MRFKLSLELTGEHSQQLPVNHQYEFASWILKAIQYSNPSFIQWLQQNGYMNVNREFQYFTFSQPSFPGAVQDGDRLIINNKEASLCVSFLNNEELASFVKGVFENQEFRIGDKISKASFIVKNVEPLTEPSFEPVMHFQTTSPLVLSKDNGKKTVFLSPEDKEFELLFFKNLMVKYASLVKFFPQWAGESNFPNLSEMKLEVLSQPKGKVVKTRTELPQPVSVKGYLFDFKITAPARLLSIGYQNGFGEQNHFGFGCTQVL